MVSQNDTIYAYLVERFIGLSENDHLGKSLLKLDMAGGEQVHLALSADLIAQLFVDGLPIVARGTDVSTPIVATEESIPRARATTVSVSPSGNRVAVNFALTGGSAFQVRLSEKSAKSLKAKLGIADIQWRELSAE